MLVSDVESCIAFAKVSLPPPNMTWMLFPIPSWFPPLKFASPCNPQNNIYLSFSLDNFTNPFTDSTGRRFFFLRHHFVSGKSRVLKHWWQAGADAREALDDCERRHESIIVLSLIHTNQWTNPWFFEVYMGVSKNNGTPKWMVYNGKPY